MTRSFAGPSVSVIIPVHNGGNKFRRCLSSVKTSRTPPAEVIVVADGETDGSWKLAKELDMKVIKQPVSGGPARARNLGAQNATGDILFFIDADVTLADNTIGQVVNSFQNDPALDALIGSYDDSPFETNFLSQYKNLLHHYVHQTSNRNASTFWGACGAIRREIFLKIDGFDEKYRHPSIEDIDLGYRLKKAGYTINLLKQIQVKHLKYWGVLSLLKADFFYRALPWTELILTEGGFIDDLNLKHASRISVMAVFMLFLTLLSSIFFSWFLVLTFFFMVLLLFLNWKLYRFYKDTHGLSFAIKTIPWHWFYFFYSGVAFFMGFVKHKIKKLGTQVSHP